MLLLQTLVGRGVPLVVRACLAFLLGFLTFKGTSRSLANLSFGGSA